MVKVQDLNNQDLLPRSEFCRFIMNNENVLPLILWDDEVTYQKWSS